MSIDFGKPLNTDLATGVLAQLRENVNSILTQGFGAGANLPTSSLRINPTTGIIESFNGSVWSRFGPLLSYWGGTTGGSANVQTMTVIPTPSALVDGQRYFFRAGYTNNGAMTLNCNSLGAINVFNNDSAAALVGGEISANSIYHVVYYSSAFYLLNADPVWTTWSPTLVGFSVVPAQASYRFQKVGRTCTLCVRHNSDGTSNSATFTISLPHTAATVTYGSWVGSCAAKDNGSYLPSPICYIPSGGTTLNLNVNASGVGFTASGAKKADCFITYETAA
jgi:hypothetical protein